MVCKVAQNAVLLNDWIFRLNEEALAVNYTSIDGKQFMNMVLAGVNKLNADKASIDSLNVFPVPDGDTGTNMSLTLNSVARFLGQIPEAEVTVSKVAEQMAYGALMGARGNSCYSVTDFRRYFKSLQRKR